jgi:hypothetical protein
MRDDTCNLRCGIAAKRPSRVVNGKSAATKPKGAAGKGERSRLRVGGSVPPGGLAQQPTGEI